MPIIYIDSLDHPGVDIFYALTEAQLRNKQHSDKGLFIAESPKVIAVALRQGFIPTALLCEERHITGDAAHIIAQNPTIPIYTGTRDVLASITGYTLSRGVLCAMKRPTLRSVESICDTASRIAIIDGVVDTTNIGAIFRSAAALGVDGILLTKSSCDPFNRRAVRVSMGSIFLIPWTWLNNGIEEVAQHGFKTVAMALRHNSIDIDDARLKKEKKLAIILGTEGDGLAESTILNTDYVVKIPMHNAVDSLNVAAASAVAFWELCKKT